MESRQAYDVQRGKCHVQSTRYPAIHVSDITLGLTDENDSCLESSAQ